MKPLNKLQTYLLSCINLKGQDFADNLNDPDKARALFACYWEEKGVWHEEQVGRVEAVKDWIQGLPSSLDIVYANHDILALWGDLFPHVLQYTELQQERIIDRYWVAVAIALVELWDNVGVIEGATTNE